MAITHASDGGTYTIELPFTVTVDLEVANLAAPDAAIELATEAATLFEIAVPYTTSEAGTITAILNEIKTELEAALTTSATEVITATAVSSSLAFKNGVVVGDELVIEDALISLAITHASDGGTYTIELPFTVTVTGILTPIS